LWLVSLVIGIVISKVSQIDDVDDVIFLPRLSFLCYGRQRLSVFWSEGIRLNDLHWLVRLLRNDHRWQLWRHLGDLRPLVRVLIQYVWHLRQQRNRYFLNDRVRLGLVAIVQNWLFDDRHRNDLLLLDIFLHHELSIL
jgi:hypothetical protein